MDGITSFGYWVRRRRKALDLTQTTLAHRLGCSVFTIRKIERDERRPSLQIAKLLANHLIIPAEEQDNFLRMARGEFVASMTSPLEAIPLPASILEGEVSVTQKDTPFVARAAELAQLNSFLDLARAGQGRVVFVAGEAGRGKTILAQEFVRQALEKELALVAAGGNCNAYSGVGDPYLPFREILGLLTGDVEARLVAGGIAQTQAQRLRELMPYTIQTLVTTGPDLIDTFVLGSSLVARTTAASGGAGWQIQLEEIVARKAAGQGSENLRQSHLFEQYSKVVQTLAGQRPLLLVLDDLQWADAGSISLLFHLGRRLQGSRTLIVGAYRPTDVAIGSDGERRHPLQPVINEFQRQFGNIQVDLRQADGKQFIEHLLDTEPNQLGPEFRDALYQHTKGHALFTVEMLRGMKERGDLVRDEVGRWIEGLSINWETLPARIEGVIGERIDRLSTRLQEALKVASVEGEDFTAEVIAQILGIREAELIRQLSGELDKQHRLVRGQNSRYVGDKRLSHYRFRHILFQRYLYNNLDAVERTYLHQAVGNELERLYGDQTGAIAIELARHFEEAGLPANAVDYLREAGNRAVRLSANAEAIAHFYRGLALVETLPETIERAQQELTLQIALIAPLAGAKGYGAPELKKVYTRAQELCEQVDEPSQMFLVLYGLWGHNLVSGDLQTAREWAVRCLSLAQSIQDTAILMEAYRIMDETSLYRGELAPALEHLNRTLSLYDPQQHHTHATLYGQDPGVASLSHGSWILWHLGYPDQALKMGQEAVALGEKLSHLFSLDFALCYVAALNQMCRDVKKAEDLVEAAITLSTREEFVGWLAMATIIRGRVMFDRGQKGDGIAQMRQGLADNRAISINMLQPYFLALLAEAYGEVGQTEEGLTMLAEALTIVEKGEVRYWEAELYRLKGELLLKDKGERQKDELSPETCFLQAIEIARRQGAKSLELRVVMSLSRLWQARGKKEEARQMLAEVYGWFTEGFDTLDLKEAGVLLEELS